MMTNCLGCFGEYPATSLEHGRCFPCSLTVTPRPYGVVAYPSPTEAGARRGYAVSPCLDIRRCSALNFYRKEEEAAPTECRRCGGPTLRPPRPTIVDLMRAEGMP
jgi:ribosomal protein L40E